MTGESPLVVTERVWTIPNLLSMLRLAGVPLFLYLLLGPKADGWAVAVLMVAGVTDWADGKLARMLDQSSRLGALLDPAADRLYILATLLAFVVRDVVPVWIVATILARDVLVGLSLLVLRRSGYQALQVNYVGKAATFNLLYAFPLLLLADGTSRLAQIAAPLAYGFTAWGGVLYLISGLAYLRQVGDIVTAERSERSEPTGRRGAQAELADAPEIERSDEVAPQEKRSVTGAIQRQAGEDPQPLLQRLLEQIRDPAYAEAAARRKRTGDSRPPPRLSNRLVLGTCLLLIGALSAVVVSQVRSSAPQREELRQALIADIANERADDDVLQERLAEVREAASSAREELLTATGEGQAALEELNLAELSAGLTAVRGPGLSVTLTDAPPPEDDSENLGRILDRDILSLVNAMWAAGAEAVAVDGQRLGPTTTIRSAGQAILVDFRPVANPYVIEAIGPAEMFRDVLESPAGRTLTSYAAAFGLGLDAVADDEIDLPPGTGAAVVNARPAPRRPTPRRLGDPR